jgi:hypothetical protein
VGNLTRDPELRFTTSGRGVASFGIAVGRRYQVNGEWQEQTSYFNVTAWGQLGENAAALPADLSSASTPLAKATSARQLMSSLTNSDQAFGGLLRKSSAPHEPMVRVQPRVVQAQLANQTRLTAAKNHSETPQLEHHPSHKGNTP